jgi:hypothetical protein
LEAVAIGNSLIFYPENSPEVIDIVVKCAIIRQRRNNFFRMFYTKNKNDGGIGYD